MKGKFLITCFFLVMLLWSLPAEAADPAECSPGLIPSNAPNTTGIGCAKDTDYTYDLSINQWNTTTHISPDILVGYEWSSPPTDDKPRFFVYKDGSNFRFYTWLYARFTNDSGSIACPDSPAAGPVKVVYSYTESSDPADATNPATVWTPIGSEYIMKISGTPGALLPTAVHEQEYPICWVLAAGERFPAHLTVRAQVVWGFEDADKLNDNTAYSVFDLSAQKTEAHIGLALDLSGSMMANFSGINTRLDIAKQKAQMFTFLVEDDQWLGVYGFATGNPLNSLFASNYTGTDNLPHAALLNHTSKISDSLTDIAGMEEINGNADRIAISNQINAQNAYGCTPIGQGLLRAKYGIDASTASATGAVSKAIVLFSDGFQNVPPFVNTDPPYTCGSNPVYTKISAEKTFKDNDIPIYSIYFGPTSGWSYFLMNQIKDQTGGSYVYGADTELELAKVYFSIRGMVDDLIYLKKDGLTSAKGPYPQFEVDFDGAADIATVASAWELGNGNTRLTIDRRKKGDSQWITAGTGFQPEMTHALPGNAVTYPSFQVYRFNAGANTTWEFRVRQLTSGSGQTKYAAAVFSNVEQASIKASLGDKGFETGDHLPLYVDLHSGGHSVVDAKVTATVKIPSRSFSSTLRKYADRFMPGTGTDPDSKRVSAIVPQLKRFLKEDTESDRIYVYNNVTLTLKDDGTGPDKKKGDGRYSAVLPGSQTHIAGDYQVTFNSRGSLSAGRTFDRTTILSTICNVGPADIAKSKVEMTVSQPQKDGKIVATITILPTDQFGNASFPGSSNNIRVISKNGKPDGGIMDNQDSTFTQVVKLEPGDTPDIEVKVGTVSLDVPTVGTGTTHPASPGQELSLHGGFSAPQGLFDIVYDNGKSLVFDYNYRLNQQLGIRLTLGFNWFKDLLGDTSLLTDVNAYLQYRYYSGRWVPYFEAGLGYYSLENSTGALGYSSGLGLRYVLSGKWDFDVSLHGHRAEGKLHISFIRFLAGFIFKL